MMCPLPQDGDSWRGRGWASPSRCFTQPREACIIQRSRAAAKYCNLGVTSCMGPKRQVFAGRPSSKHSHPVYKHSAHVLHHCWSPAASSPALSDKPCACTSARPPWRAPAVPASTTTCGTCFRLPSKRKRCKRSGAGRRQRRRKRGSASFRVGIGRGTGCMVEGLGRPSVSVRRRRLLRPLTVPPACPPAPQPSRRSCRPCSSWSTACPPPASTTRWVVQHCAGGEDRVRRQMAAAPVDNSAVDIIVGSSAVCLRRWACLPSPDPRLASSSSPPHAVAAPQAADRCAHGCSARLVLRGSEPGASR